MRYTILDELESAAYRHPHRYAIRCEEFRCTYSQLLYSARAAGTALTSLIGNRDAVGIYMDKTAQAVELFYGTIYAGGFYSVLNPSLPDTRLRQIVGVLSPAVIVTDREHAEDACRIFGKEVVVLAEDLLCADIDLVRLETVRGSIIDTNVLYVNFTSGSTGTPKGIAVSHRSVLDFIGFFTEIFKFSHEDVIANQAPFDFDVSVKDIYAAVHTGAELLIIPRSMFSEPVKLADYLCKYRATVMTWAVSALCLLTAFHVLECCAPESVRIILFSGEVMPARALKYIRKYMPETLLVNLYGPTEITCNCTYHILDSGRDYAEGIPIGKAFPNEEVFLLDGNDHVITRFDETGEICVRGTALALGYFGSAEQNAVRFVQDPRNPNYPERIYRTGDLGRYLPDGDLMFCGRKDFQIKHMGHRIELEEIDHSLSVIEGIERCCCLFDEKHSALHAFYQGAVEPMAVLEELKKALPVYMIPSKLHLIDQWPLTKNGKTDRTQLAGLIGGKRR